MNDITLSSPTITVTVLWSQPDGHAASDWQFNLYQADGVTLIEQTGSTFSPLLASGTEVTLTYPLLPLQNGDVAILTVSMKDSVTGVWSESGAWQLTCVWTPPSPPSGLVYTSDTLNGIGRLSWANGGGTSTIMVEMQQVSPGGVVGPWQLQYQGPATDHIGLPEQATRRDYNFRVTGISAPGLPSTGAVVSGQLGLVGGRLGVWFMSLDLKIKAVVGIPYDMTSTKFAMVDDVVGVVTLGSKEESDAEGITDFINATQQWWLPAIFRRGLTVPIYGHDTWKALRALKESGQPFIYKDPRGRSVKAKFRNWSEQDDVGGQMYVFFDVRQVRYDGLPIVDLT